MPALLLWISLLPWWLSTSTPPEDAGPTLFPDRVHDGERLRFLVGGSVREEPRRTADVLRTHAAGDTVVAITESPGDGLRWVRIGNEGWVEAARVDRLPEPLEADPEPGREGLAAGRVLPWSYHPSDLVGLPDSLKAPGFEGKSLRLRQEAAERFAQLVSAARSADVAIAAFSAFRSAEYQRRLYARAAGRDPGQRDVAAPGRSEHQLGTTVDVGSPGTSLADDSLERTPAGRWIREHAEEFGFVVSFSRNRHAGRGVAFEPWHLRWVGRHVEDESGW